MPVVLCITAFNKYLTSKTVDKRIGLKCAGGELYKTEVKKSEFNIPYRWKLDVHYKSRGLLYPEEDQSIK